MKLGFLVTLAFVAALAGCRVRAHYVQRDYAYLPPPPPSTRVATDIEVQGSDGTVGWRRACNADVAIHQVSEQMARKGCQVSSYGYDETRAVCGDTPLLVRRDATHIYRLCDPSTDRESCRHAWARVMAR